MYWHIDILREVVNNGSWFPCALDVPCTSCLGLSLLQLQRGEWKEPMLRRGC